MKKALIVIDMQYDFIDGSLGTNEAQNILPNVKDLIDKKDYDKLFFTRDTHYENYLDTQEGKNLPVKHCIKNTHGWQIHEILNPKDSLSIISAQSVFNISCICHPCVFFIQCFTGNIKYGLCRNN